jgi:hypothetical protein
MRPLALTLLVAGCTASAEQVAPPQYNFYFPTGMVTSPDEHFLFVISADSDLRFSDGALHTIDLDQVDAIANAWRDQGAKPDACTPLPDRPTVLSCPTTQRDGTPISGMVEGGSVEIGSFGVGIGVQPLKQGGAPTSMLRVFATVRGDPSLTWMDFDMDSGRMNCGPGTGFTRCDEAHRLARLRNDLNLPVLPPEPFYLAVDGPNEHVFVTHFTTGQVSLASAPSEVGSSPILQDTLSTLWNLTIIGSLGAVGIAPRLPGDPSGLVYVTSRVEARVGIVHAVPGPDALDGTPTEQLVRSGSFYYNGLQIGGLLFDARGVTFSPDGNRAYIISRTPSSLQIFDTSLDASGAPRNRALATIELCEQPANLGLADFGEGPRVALPCFANGQLWVVDPEQQQLIATEDSGRGPNGVAVSARHKKIYVGNYAEDTIMVIDATPGLPAQYRAILRLGTERPVGLQ